MPSSVSRVLAPLLLIVAAFDTAAAKLLSQSKAASIASPDVAGFRIGTTLAEASKQLAGYSLKQPVEPGDVAVPELGPKPVRHALQRGGTEPTTPEVIQLDLTLPPGEQRVWKITRRLFFPNGAGRQTTLAALREKYGQEFPADQQSFTYSWYFGRDGKRAMESASLSYRQCHFAPFGDLLPNVSQTLASPTHNPYVRPTPYPEDLPPIQRACLPLLTVRAVVRPGVNPEILQALEVSLTDLGLGIEAKQATYEAILKAQSQQNQQQIDKANQQPKPKL